MAITANDNIKALLKAYYKDGVENLMFRNSPLLKKINKNRIEGKTYNFSAMYGRGGAVAGDFTKAKALAATVSKNVEFQVEPGQLFSVYSMNAKEVQASQTQRGAYMKVAGNKMFASAEGFRKTLAASLYGSGYGELCFAPTTALSTSAVDITLPADAIMKIDVGSELVVKQKISASATKCTLTVNSINGNVVNVTGSGSYTPTATDVICLAGSMDASGAPLLPVGLGGWLPVVGKRTGSVWTSYIAKPFFGVSRDTAADRLAGAFYKAGASESMSDTVQALLMKVRRQGSLADLIVLNDEDWLKLASEIQTTNTYFTDTAAKAKKTPTVGVEAFQFSMSTSWVENVIDDPYCPKGQFYILDSTSVEFDTLTNVDKVSDGIANNEAGKPNPLSEENNGKENNPYQLIIDDYINVQSGQADVNGPASDVTLMLFGTFAITNPSNCGVGLFKDASVVGVSD